MSKSFKKTVSFVLSMLMVLTTVCFFYPFGSDKLKANAADYNTKAYSTEYYYPEGTWFVKNFAMSYSSTNSTAKNGVKNGINYHDSHAAYTGYSNTYHDNTCGAGFIDKDVTAGSGGSKDIYVGYTMTKDPAEACTGIRIACNDGYDNYIGANTKTYTSGVEWWLCNSGANSAYAPKLTSDGAFDLNKKTGGRDIFMYASYDRNLSSALSLVIVTAGRSKMGDGWDYATSFKSNGIQDLNSGNGGDDLFFHYYTPCTTVDSTLLRRIATTASNYVGSSNYTSASMATLTAAYNKAVGIINDLNADGYTTSNQTAINEATTALRSALDSLKTTVYFNGNGGTSTAPSKEFTIGTNTTAIVNVADVTASRDKYLFKGWSNSTTATEGKNEFTLGFNNTLYAAWLSNSYWINIDTGTGYTLSESRKEVEYDGTFKFTLTLDDEYSLSNPVVKSGAVSLNGTRSGNTITYVLSNVRASMNFTVTGVEKNKYEVKVIADDGAVVGGAVANVVHGNDHEFTVILKEGYTQNPPVAKIGDTELDPTINGGIYTYKVTNVTAPVTVHVTTQLNKYTVGFTGGDGYKFNKGDTVVSHGDNLEFTLTLTEGYTQSAPKVYANGVELKASIDGNVYSYELTGISADTTVTVEGVKKNTYGNCQRSIFADCPHR